MIECICVTIVLDAILVDSQPSCVEALLHVMQLCLGRASSKPAASSFSPLKQRELGFTRRDVSIILSTRMLTMLKLFLR